MSKLVRSKLAMCATAFCATLLLPACTTNDIAQSFKELTGISLTTHDIELKKQYLFSAYVFEDFVPAIAHYYAFNRTTFAVYTDEQASDMVSKQYEALADVLQQNGAAVCRTAASCDGRATNITTSLINAEDGAFRFINVATDKLNLTRMYSSRGESLGPMSVLAQKRALYRSKLTKPNAYRPAQDFEAILAEQEIEAARARTLAETQDVFIDDNAAATANITTATAAASSQNKATRSKARNKSSRAKTAAAKSSKTTTKSQPAVVAQAPAKPVAQPAAKQAAPTAASAANKQTAQAGAQTTAAQAASLPVDAKPAPDPKATASTAATAAKPDAAPDSIYSTVKQFPFFQGFSLLSDANAGELDDIKDMAKQAQDAQVSTTAAESEHAMTPNPKSLISAKEQQAQREQEVSHFKSNSDILADVVLSHCDVAAPMIQAVIDAVNFRSLVNTNAYQPEPEPEIAATEPIDDDLYFTVEEIEFNVKKRQQSIKDWTLNKPAFERHFATLPSANSKPSSAADPKAGSTSNALASADSRAASKSSSDTLASVGSAEASKSSSDTLASVDSVDSSSSDALAFVAYGDENGRKAVC